MRAPRTERVLLVDPDTTRRVRLTSVLRAAGRHVTGVTTPLEAIFLRAYVSADHEMLRQVRVTGDPAPN